MLLVNDVVDKCNKSANRKQGASAVITRYTVAGLITQGSLCIIRVYSA
jgi:hypothetical protein